MCENCEGCEGCEGCECGNGVLFACLCCHAAEPVAETYSDTRQDKKKKEEAPTPPLVMLRPEGDGYQTL